jgi:ribonuclease R
MAHKKKKKANFIPASAASSTRLLDRDIIRCFNKSPQIPKNAKEIAALLKLNGGSYESKIYETMQRMAQRGEIEQISSSKFRLQLSSQVHTGKLSLNREGYFEVFIETMNDYVPIKGPVKAFVGDTVTLQLEQGRSRPVGFIIDVTERKRILFVGTLDITTNHIYCIPADNKLKTEFIIPGKDLNGAKSNEKVVVEITKWTGDKPQAKVVQILGPSGKHSTEMHAILLEFGLEPTFPPEVEEFAAQIPHQIPDEEIANRRDFRPTLTFTIDPVDAKDYDDAISFKIIAEDVYEIGVHIADVTHYLTPQSILDREAFERATSVYLVDRVVPMLPEVLSNNLCSLVPHQDRLTYSAVFQLNGEGKILDEWFGRTVIHSDQRFSYEQVQETLETGEGLYADVMLTINQIAHKLRQQRFKEGSVSFETEEVKFELDSEGKPIGVYAKVRKDAHKLIEDYMLLANRRVALFVANYRKSPTIPFVYRVHPPPDDEKLISVKSFVKNFGYDFDISDKKNLSKAFNELSAAVEGTPFQNIIESYAIRSMAKAIYTTDNIGHYGLGFHHYTHFTSPIRRYPDVIAHRILDQVLRKDFDNINPLDLEYQCKHCSQREKNAADAERASIRYKQVEYLTAVIGQSFEGIISGVTDWGVYVELLQNKCEGLISIRDMRDDQYALNHHRYQLVGKYGGKIFQLGDRLIVKVKKTNLLRRTVDFELVEHLFYSKNRSKKQAVEEPEF